MRFVLLALAACASTPAAPNGPAPDAAQATSDAPTEAIVTIANGKLAMDLPARSAALYGVAP